jgi:hypothetical protein
VRYATVATVTDTGSPWNSPVAHEIDPELNIYWFSDKENVHSKNVRHTPRAFIVIYDSTADEGEGEGVYIEANVKELNDAAEINEIRNLKKGKVVDDAVNFIGAAARRCYKAVPVRVWMNDVEEKDGVFIRDYRNELNIEDLKSVV